VYPVGLDLLLLSQGVIHDDANVKSLFKAFKCSVIFCPKFNDSAHVLLKGMCYTVCVPASKAQLSCLAVDGLSDAGSQSQVIRMALTKRKKALGFVSSVGIVAGISHPEPILESEDALSLASEHAGDGIYAMG